MIKMYFKHSLVLVYLLFFFLILVGLYRHSGFTYIIPTVVFFAIPFLILYYFLNHLRIQMPKLDIGGKWSIRGLLVLSIGITILDLIILGNIPMLTALSADFQSEINTARSSIGEKTPLLMKYLVGWNIKAIAPFLLFCFVKMKQWKSFFIFGLFASLFAVGLMQKSFILWIWTPSLIYFLLQKKWWKAGALAVFNLFVLYAMVFMTNAVLMGGIYDLYDTASRSQDGTIVTKGLYTRVVLLPGNIVGEWYSIIPKQKPFLNGKDFGLYCALTKQEKKNYSLELYPIIYPQFAERGLKGSVNVAHFMRSYCNFGYLGLTLAALLLALIFFFVFQLAEPKNLEMTLSLHAFPIVLLNSGSILTILMSGGWGLIFVLIWTHKAYLYESE